MAGVICLIFTFVHLTLESFIITLWATMSALVAIYYIWFFANRVPAGYTMAFCVNWNGYDSRPV